METLSCTICIRSFDNDHQQAIVLPCGHTFCAECTRGSRNNCPTCRKPFNDDQITKNYIVHSLLDEIHAQPPKNQERCVTHKREIDRCCKSCSKLMCSVCKCPHVQNEKEIISDMNLREDAEKILEAYKDVGKVKEDFGKKIDEHLKQKASEAEKNQFYDSEQISEFAQIEIKSIHEDEDMAVKKIEDDAQRKIQEIEAQKRVLISKAKEDATRKIQDIESRTAGLLAETRLKHNNLITDAKKKCAALKRQSGALQDLSKFKVATLEECLIVYKLEQLQRRSLQEFLILTKSDLDSLLASAIFSSMKPKDNLPVAPAKWKVRVGDNVRFGPKGVTATVENVLGNEILISYKDDGYLCQEWVKFS